MNTQYWEEEIETMSREKLQELQLQRLKKTINIAANAPYYKEVFSKHNITADNIQSLDDIRKIPFTTKADMRANYPFGLVAGDMQNDGVRIHSDWLPSHYRNAYVSTLPVVQPEIQPSLFIHSTILIRGLIW